MAILCRRRIKSRVPFHWNSIGISNLPLTNVHALMQHYNYIWFSAVESQSQVIVEFKSTTVASSRYLTMSVSNCLVLSILSLILRVSVPASVFVHCIWITIEVDDKRYQVYWDSNFKYDPSNPLGPVPNRMLNRGAINIFFLDSFSIDFVVFVFSFALCLLSYEYICLCAQCQQPNQSFWPLICKSP